jgi:hypothetical protein
VVLVSGLILSAMFGGLLAILLDDLLGGFNRPRF